MLARRLCLSAVIAALSTCFAASAWANVPANAVAYRGSDQTTHPGAAFAHPLLVLVTDSGGAPVAGADVNFSATSSTGGATAQLSAPTAQTNSAGIASVTAPANSIARFYSGQTSGAGVATPPTFSLGNGPQG